MAFYGGGMNLQVDISGGTGSEELRAAGRGFYLVEFELGDRVEVRRLVDGDRSVPVSERLLARAEFVRDASDPVQGALLSAAGEGRRVKFICGDPGFSRCGSAVPVISRVFRGDISGICYSVRLET